MMRENVKYKRLYKEMKERGEKEVHVAVFLNISLVSVRNKLLGKTEWKGCEIKRLCEHYALSFEELFGE